MQKYTLQQLQQDFPTEEACLRYILKKKGLRGRWYKVNGRKCFVNKYGKQVYPLVGTLFESSRTPLTLWFYAIYLFSVSKNGVSAAELQRHLGVTYKCAFRMAQQIRGLMKPSKALLKGIVEVDETYVGGKHHRKYGFRKKIPVLGMVERGGQVRAKVLPQKGDYDILTNVSRHVSKKSHMMSDEAGVYFSLPKIGFHQWSHVKHGKRHWTRGITSTNTIEGFWGQLKPSLKGTYRAVSKQHLQSYLDEFVWRYNHRKSDAFSSLLARI